MCASSRPVAGSVPQRFTVTRPGFSAELPDRVQPIAIVWVESERDDQDGALRIEGDPEVASDLREALRNSYGMRARPLDEGIAPEDLRVALLNSPLLLPYAAVELT